MDSNWNIFFRKNQFFILFALAFCIFAGFGVKNLTRSRAGRAYSAIRDGDIAAEAIGINLFKFKSSAFALSSFYAGIGGAIFLVFLEVLSQEHLIYFIQ